MVAPELVPLPNGRPSETNDARCTTPQTLYGCNSTEPHSASYNGSFTSLTEYVFIEKPPDQMTESDRLTRMPLSKLLPKTLDPFNTVRAPQYTITLPENSIHIASQYIGSLTPTAMRATRTESTKNFAFVNTEQPTTDYRSCKSAAQIVGEYTVKNIVEHI